MFTRYLFSPPLGVVDLYLMLGSLLGICLVHYAVWLSCTLWLIILSTIISFYILKIAFLILKQRSALKQLDGFQRTGHWFSGHTSLKHFHIISNFRKDSCVTGYPVMIHILFDMLYTILSKRQNGFILLGWRTWEITV